MRLLGIAASLLLTVSLACNQQPAATETAASGAETASVEAPGTTPTGEPWTTAQLMAPATLAEQLKGNGPKPVVFDMGPAGVIKGAVEIGPAQDEANLAKLRAEVAKLPKDQPVVVYCGCCPYVNCPNVRPAFKALAEAGLQRPYLLDLPENLKANWIDHGYEVE